MGLEVSIKYLHVKQRFLVMPSLLNTTMARLSGAYEGYRPPFTNAPSSGYGPAQMNTPRDYSNSSYQRVSTDY